MFDDPKGLPPPRVHDHHIPLTGGTHPISVRPYCCPHYQKNELDKIMREMLQAGIAHPSQSPFIAGAVSPQK